MEFEWDENKRTTNVKKHGLDFIDAKYIFEGDIITIEDSRFAYGEQRLISFGLLQGHVFAVVHTENADTIRIISARKATRNEAKNYFTHLTD